VSENPYLNAALTYARAGIPVFRCTFPINSDWPGLLLPPGRAVR
jgi:hypothetical protein